jgi:hypothetical protein
MMSVVFLLVLSVSVYADPLQDTLGEEEIAGYDIDKVTVEVYDVPIPDPAPLPGDFTAIPERIKISLDMANGSSLPGLVMFEFDVDGDQATGGNIGLPALFRPCSCTPPGCPKIKPLTPGYDVLLLLLLREQDPNSSTSWCADCIGPGEGQCFEKNTPCDGSCGTADCYKTDTSCDPDSGPNCYVTDTRCQPNQDPCNGCYEMTQLCTSIVPCNDPRRIGEWYANNTLGIGGGTEADRGRIEMPLPRATDSDSEDCYVLPWRRIVEAVYATIDPSEPKRFDLSAAINPANLKWQVSTWYDTVTPPNDFFHSNDPLGPCSPVSDVVPDTGQAGGINTQIADVDSFCEANRNGDKNSDAADVSKFLEDFGRSTFFKPCPPCDIER